MSYKKYKGGNSFYDLMVRIFGRLVINGRKTIDEVPEPYRADVSEWIAEGNY